jgi:hypothetical protein
MASSLLKNTLYSLPLLIMFVQLIVAHPLTWKTYPSSTFTGGRPLSSVLHYTAARFDSVVLVTGPENRASYRYKPITDELGNGPPFGANNVFLFDSAGAMTSRGDRQYWLFGSMNDTFYTAASSYSSWDITFNLPPFNLTNAAFIFNPVNYTYHVLGGLDRETRQANEKHWVQNATSIENTDPWVTWPEPPSTLGADAKAYYEPIDQRIYTIDGNGFLQVLHLSNTSWTISNLLYPVTKAGLVRVEDELLIIGGETVPSTNGTMVQRMNLKTWEWTQYPNELPVPFISRNNVVLMGEHVYGFTHDFMIVAYCANLSVCATVDPSQCSYFCWNGTCTDPMDECEDGNPCTINDQCRAGKCYNGDRLVDGTDCDDGESCLIGDKCEKGFCQTGLIWNPDCTTPTNIPINGQTPSNIPLGNQGPSSNNPDGSSQLSSSTRISVHLLWLLAPFLM